MSETLRSFKEMLHPKNFPKDIALVLIWLVLTVLAVYVPVVSDSCIRIIFTVPVLLFIPGYVLTAALFPNRLSEKKGIDGIERFALSVGLSVAVVPLIGLVLNYTPFGIRLDPVTVSLVVFTLVMVLVTLIRRASLPLENQFYVPFERVVPAVKNELFAKDDKKFDRVLSVILIVVIAAVVITAVCVIVFPSAGEKFTEFYILGTDKTADKYPSQFNAGKEQFVWIGVENHEARDVGYTMDVLFLNAAWDDESSSLKIDKEMAYARVSIPVEDGGEYLEKYSFTVPDKSYNRVEFLLYGDEEVPDEGATAEEKMDAAYRELHLWVTVK